jgi:hypothetical protein
MTSRKYSLIDCFESSIIKFRQSLEIDERSPIIVERPVCDGCNV